MKNNSNDFRSHKALHGFTLIELLVVISIIALLLSIIVPAMSKVKMKARSVQCMSNMKQQSLLIRLYTDDNDGRFPERGRAYPHYVHFGGGFVEKAWTALDPYVEDPYVTICPAMASYRMDAGDIFKDPYATAYSGVYGGWRSGAGIIVTAYAWLFNMDDGSNVTYFSGSRPWPARQEDCGSSSALATHLLAWSAVGQRYEDWGHEASSKGRVYSSDINYLRDDVTVFTSESAPILYGDGSVISVVHGQFQKRAEMNGLIYYY